MKIVLNTRNLLRNLLLLVIALVTAGYYLHYQSTSEVRPSRQVNMLSLSPIVKDLRVAPEPPPKPEPVTAIVQISKNQTFSELMENRGFDPETIQNIYESSKKIYNLAQIHVGKNIFITTTANNEIVTLAYSIDPLKTLVISKKDDLIEAQIQERKIEVRVEELGGFIEGSLYSTIDSLGEEDQLVLDFAEIFEWDVDFSTELQQGDSFRLIYEKQYVDGETLGYGRILAAELTNKGYNYSAFGYQHDGRWEFFSADGKAMRRAFLASPLKFSRISSGFTNRRYHPVLKKYRAHYGIDYVAPVGTPVRTIGSGTVASAGWAGGHGKSIKISHAGGIATMYSHLSRFAGGIRSGARVSQGQVIGYVGSTGMSTGPHLDFKYIKNGTYVNFLKVKSPQAAPLTAQEIEQFKQSASSITQQLGNVKLLPSRSDLPSLAKSAPQLTEEVR